MIQEYNNITTSIMLDKFKNIIAGFREFAYRIVPLLKRIHIYLYCHRQHCAAFNKAQKGQNFVLRLVYFLYDAF